MGKNVEKSETREKLPKKENRPCGKTRHEKEKDISEQLRREVAWKRFKKKSTLAYLRQGKNL
jgi:hypothetical protein